MSHARLIATMLLNAEAVHAYQIKADGSRGEEYEVTEWNQCDFSDFDLTSFRVIYGSKFEMWYDELDDSEIEGNFFIAKGVEFLITPISESN